MPIVSAVLPMVLKVSLMRSLVASAIAVVGETSGGTVFSVLAKVLGAEPDVVSSLPIGGALPMVKRASVLD